MKKLLLIVAFSLSYSVMGSFSPLEEGDSLTALQQEEQDLENDSTAIESATPEKLKAYQDKYKALLDKYNTRKIELMDSKYDKHGKELPASKENKEELEIVQKQMLPMTKDMLQKIYVQRAKIDPSYEVTTEGDTFFETFSDEQKTQIKSLIPKSSYSSWKYYVGLPVLIGASLWAAYKWLAGQKKTEDAPQKA